MKIGKIRQDKEAEALLILLGVIGLLLICGLLFAILDKVYPKVSLIIFLMLAASTIDSWSIDIDKYKAVLIFDPLFQTTRALFEGFYFKLPWEEVEKEVSLKTEIESNIEETAPTKDGSVSYKASIMSKPNFEHEEFSPVERLILFASFTESAIKGQLESVFKNTIREKINEHTSEDAVRLKSDDIVKACRFYELEDKLAVKVIKSVVKDIDYNEQTQKMRNSLFGGLALVELTKLLVEQGGYTPEEAKSIAPLISDHVKLNKEIKEFKISGIELPKELTEAIVNFFKNKKP